MSEKLPWGVTLEHDFDRLIVHYPRSDAFPLPHLLPLAGLIAAGFVYSLFLAFFSQDSDGLLGALLASSMLISPMLGFMGLLVLTRLTHSAPACELHATTRSIKLVRAEPHDEVAIAREDIRSVRRVRGHLVIETATGPVKIFAKRSRFELAWTAAMLRTLSTYDARQPDALKAIPQKLQALLSRR